jgi:hypothetical protein
LENNKERLLTYRVYDVYYKRCIVGTQRNNLFVFQWVKQFNLIIPAIYIYFVVNLNNIVFMVVLFR